MLSNKPNQFFKVKNMTYTVIFDSKDSKLTRTDLGESMVAIYGSKDTCHRGCPLYEKCYAKHGRTNITFGRLTEGDPLYKPGYGYGFDMVLKKLNTIRDRFVRGMVSGEHPSEKDNPDILDLVVLAALSILALINNLKYYSYTHLKGGFESVHYTKRFKSLLNKNICINISTDSISEAISYAKQNLPTVVTLSKKEIPSNVWKIDNTIFQVCPNDLNKKAKCNRCQLCMKHDRKQVIVFKKKRDN